MQACPSPARADFSFPHEIVAYLVGSVVYNVFFHPLRKFPGPFWHRASRLPYCYRTAIGMMTFDVLELHRKYGEVVRIAPDELVFANSRAWKDIMGVSDFREQDIAPPLLYPFSVFCHWSPNEKKDRTPPYLFMMSRAFRFPSHCQARRD